MNDPALKKQIRDNIVSIIDEDYGFEVYAYMKVDPIFRRIGFMENDGFKDKIKLSIIDTIRKTYLSQDAEYDHAENFANNQLTYYVIRQDKNYEPFQFLQFPDDEIQYLSDKDIDDIIGIAFRFGYGDKVLWAYQHIWNTSVAHKKKGFWGVTGYDKGEDVFVEFTKSIIPFSDKIQALIIGDRIISKDMNFMSQKFGLEIYVRAGAKDSIKKIENAKYITDSEKLYEFIRRSKPKYARKLLRINKSKLFEHKKKDIIRNIKKSDRWGNTFNFDGDRIVLSTYKDVENFIDLFDERYTNSLVTGEEYDTDVKKPADPVEKPQNK